MNGESSGPIECFDFLLGKSRQGVRTALVTIVGIAGGFSRSLGTHMAASEDGAWVGSLSGGCVEAGVAGEARRVIENGQAELLRIGSGSRLIDIRLPCGGALDLLIVPDPSPGPIGHARDLLSARSPVRLAIGLDGTIDCRPAEPTDGTLKCDDMCIVRHNPALRMIVLGQGEELEAVRDLALAFGAEVEVLSPDAVIVNRLRERGGAAHVLKTPRQTALMRPDDWTAVLFLFHDHEWEAELMAQALGQPHFFVGAMGSRATQRARRVRLRELGLSDALLDAVRSPVGLIPSARDPRTLALSALAEIVLEFQRKQGACS